MAKRKRSRKPNWFAQMWQVLKMTVNYDRSYLWWILLSLLGPIVLGVALAFLISRGNVFGFIMWVTLGVLTGILVALTVLGRLAERAAYSQIEGKPGAVGAVIKTSLKRGWTGSEMPVAVNAKSQDAAYRVVGRGGIVLIGEGPKHRTQKLLNDEKRKTQRIVPNVPITFLFVGPDDDSVPLYQLAGKIGKTKKTLTRVEVTAVNNRLHSMEGGYGLPKGIDPTKARVDRRAMRGK